MGISMATSEHSFRDNSFNRFVAKLYGILALIVMVTYGLALLVVLSMFFSPEGGTFADQTYSIIRVNLLYFCTASVRFEVKVWQIFLMLNIIFCLSFISAFFSNERCPSAIKKMLVNGDMEAFQSNFLLFMPGLSSAILLVTTVINILGERAGVSVGGPSFTDPFSEIFILSYAAVSEEIGFRLVPILIPIAAYMLYRSKNNLKEFTGITKIFMPILAILKPELYQRNIGLDSTKILGYLKFSLILLSSLMFSYAHVFSGSWGWGKFPSTFIAGVVIGACSVKYGFDSAVLLHWFFNYYWSAFSWMDSLGGPLSLIYEFVYIITVYLGMFLILFVVFNLLAKNQDVLP